MKIIYFATYYPNYLDFFYKQNPNLKHQSYQIQLQALLDDAFGSFWSYATEANKQGHKAHLIIANAKPLQMAWAKENNIPFDETNWQFSLPILQTKLIAPDVFYIGSMFNYYGAFLDEIKKHSKKVFGWISCPMPDNLFRKTHPELILSSAPHYVENFKKLGIHSELLTAFFDEKINEKLVTQKEVENPKYDITFVGSVGVAHKKRLENIEKMIEKTPIQLFGCGFNSLDTRNRILRTLFPAAIKKRYKKEAWGLEMYEILQNSKITFNVHGEIAEGFGVNMRMYEATGVGTLLLTDGKGKNQLFTDQEVVYYENIDDAIEKANYYLQPENEQARQKIAQAGQKRTLKDYNAEKNVAQMLAYFEKYLK